MVQHHTGLQSRTLHPSSDDSDPFTGRVARRQHSTDVQQCWDSPEGSSLGRKFGVPACSGFLTTACFCCWSRSLSRARMPHGSPLWCLSAQLCCACLKPHQAIKPHQPCGLSLVQCASADSPVTLHAALHLRHVLFLPCGGQFLILASS